MNPLVDKEFLKELDLYPNRETFVKILSLNAYGEPQDELQGRVTSGSINIDGDSAVRRTCSLTLVSEEVNLREYNWSLKTRIQIFIGLKNKINKNYPDIIWFNQGVYIITSFNSSQSTSGYTISINGSDKMCLLNGTVGGMLPGVVDFKNEVLYENSYIEVYFDTPVYKIGEYYSSENLIYKLSTDEIFNDKTIYYSKDFITFTINGFTYFARPGMTWTMWVLSEFSKQSFLIEEGGVIHSWHPHGQYEDQNHLLKDGVREEASNYIIEGTNYVLERPFEEEENIYTFSIGGNLYRTDNINQTWLSWIESRYNTGASLFNYSLSDSILYFNEETRIESLPETIEPNYEYQFIVPYEEHYKQMEEFTINQYLPNKYYVLQGDNYVKTNLPYNATQHYFTQDSVETPFYEVNFITHKYEAHKYYYYDYSLHKYVLSNDVYNPTIQYYKRLVDDQMLRVLPIKTIIKEAVHTYGGEPYYNIIINDVDDYAIQLMEYRGDVPLYIYMLNNVGVNMTQNLNKDVTCYLIKDNVTLDSLSFQIQVLQEVLKSIDSQEAKEQAIINFLRKNSEFPEEQISIESDMITYNTLVENFNINPTKVMFIEPSKGLNNDFNIYTIAKLEYGEAAGYEETEFIYPEDLISSLGDSVTSMLDKLKEKFNNFEYFYDLDGRFVFQQKKTSLNTSWNNIVETIVNDESRASFVDNSKSMTSYEYSFDDNEMILTVGNNVKIDNLKNDFAVWGEKKGIGDTKVPIHARYAIDTKPVVYKSFPSTHMNYEKEEPETEIDLEYGFGENMPFLVQHIYYSLDSEEYKRLTFIEEDGTKTLPTDEVIYTPIEFSHYLPDDINTLFYGTHLYYHYCDWREIIYQMALDFYKFNQFDDFEVKLKQFNPDTCANGNTGYERYYIDIQGFQRLNYNPEPEIDFTSVGGTYCTWYDYDIIKKSLITTTSYEPSYIDYLNMNCDFYLPEKDKEYYNNKIEQLRDYYQEQLDKWSQAKEDQTIEDIEILENQIENCLNTIEELEKEYNEAIYRRDNYENIKQAKINLSNINKTLEKNQIQAQTDIAKLKKSIKSILTNFGYTV